MNDTDRTQATGLAPLLPDIRPTPRAVILQSQQLLVLRKEGYPDGTRYALPGGAQEPGETLHQALLRECEEEIATPVVIGELLHIADHFKLRDSEPPTRRHVLEMLFRCEVPQGYKPQNGHRPDKHQVAVQWLPLEDLPSSPLYPPYLSQWIKILDEPHRPVYLGEV